MNGAYVSIATLQECNLPSRSLYSATRSLPALRTPSVHITSSTQTRTRMRGTLLASLASLKLPTNQRSCLACCFLSSYSSPFPCQSLFPRLLSKSSSLSTDTTSRTNSWSCSPTSRTSHQISLRTRSTSTLLSSLSALIRTCKHSFPTTRTPAYTSHYKPIFTFKYVYTLFCCSIHSSVTRLAARNVTTQRSLRRRLAPNPDPAVLPRSESPLQTHPSNLSAPPPPSWQPCPPPPPSCTSPFPQTRSSPTPRLSAFRARSFCPDTQTGPCSSPPSPSRPLTSRAPLPPPGSYGDTPRLCTPSPCLSPETGPCPGPGTGPVGCGGYRSPVAPRRSM